MVEVTGETTQIARMDWPSMHEAMKALDEARRSVSGVTFGYDGIADALGGTYFGPHFESRGLAGYVLLSRALVDITSHAWMTIHGARARVRKERDESYVDGWVAMYPHGSALLPLSPRRSPGVRRFSTRRGASIVAGRRGGLVRSGAELLSEHSARIEDEARAAVRTMLAARRVYDLLVAAGVIERATQSITMGADETMPVTGLRWLAGEPSEGRPVTRAQAERFAAGAPIAVALA